MSGFVFYPLISRGIFLPCPSSTSFLCEESFDTTNGHPMYESFSNPFKQNQIQASVNRLFILPHYVQRFLSSLDFPERTGVESQSGQYLFDFISGSRLCQAPGLTQAGYLQHSACHSHSMAYGFIPFHCLKHMGDCVPEVEKHAPASVLFIFCNILHFRQKRFLDAESGIFFQKFACNDILHIHEELLVSYASVFCHFRHSVKQRFLVKRLKKGLVRKNSLGMVKHPHKIFPRLKIDSSFASDRTVYLSQKRSRHVYIIHSSFECACRKACHVANNSASHGNQHIVPVGLHFRKALVYHLQCFYGLVRLSRRYQDCPFLRKPLEFFLHQVSMDFKNILINHEKSLAVLAFHHKFIEIHGCASDKNSRFRFSNPRIKNFHFRRDSFSFRLFSQAFHKPTRSRPCLSYP